MARQSVKGGDDRRCFVPQLTLEAEAVVTAPALEQLACDRVAWLAQCWPAAHAELRAVYPVLRDWVLDQLEVQ